MDRHLGALKSSSSRCLLTELVCSPFSAATMFIPILTPPSARVTQQRVGGKKGISQAVDPLVRHRCPVWTLQLHTWEIQNQFSGKQKGSALSCSCPSSPQVRPLTSTALFLSVGAATLLWTSNNNTQCPFVKAQIKKELGFPSACKGLTPPTLQQSNF